MSEAVPVKTGVPGGILPLRLEAIHFHAGGLPLIDDFSFEVTKGGPTLLVGPNGAGKSLLLRICHGLIAPSRGRIFWGGGNKLSPANVQDVRRRQAMIFQRPVLLRRSVAANLDFALKLRGLPLPQRRERVARALHVAQLEHLAQRQATVLSGGEQQRVAMARAWAVEPEMMLLDEPSANLDPASTRALEAVIADIVAAGTKILMATHDLGQARRLAEEVLLIHKGRMLERATALDFFAAPRSAAAKAFLRGDLLL